MSWALVLIVALQLLIMAVNVLLRLAININLLLLVDVLLYGALITLLRRRRDRICRRALGKATLSRVTCLCRAKTPIR